MLTTQEITHFETFGYLHLRQAFSPAEMQDISREADELWREDLEDHLGDTQPEVTASTMNKTKFRFISLCLEWI